MAYVVQVYIVRRGACSNHFGRVSKSLVQLKALVGVEKEGVVVIVILNLMALVVIVVVQSEQEVSYAYFCCC